jgi:signal transduction histidine kinase
MNLESIHQSVNGDKIWVSTSKVPYRNEDGDVVGIIGIVQDITYYKETEIMLKELNQSKDKFFSIMAHDIRNPLGSFMQLTSLLYDDYAEFTEEERLECIETIKNSANNLYSLLLNLLEWSRSQQGSINFNPEIYDLKSTIEDIFDLFSLTAEQKKITINNNLKKFLAVKYDPNLIKTVVRNLLSNAIKFTPEGGSIEIGLIEQPDCFCIFIKDTGLGIPQETIDKLFRIDTNVISSLGTNDETGTGLGLILCKEFIDKHKGKIWVESELGKGSTFYFTLPKQ